MTQAQMQRDMQVVKRCGRGEVDFVNHGSGFDYFLMSMWTRQLTRYQYL